MGRPTGGGGGGHRSSSSHSSGSSHRSSSSYRSGGSRPSSLGSFSSGPRPGGGYGYRPSYRPSYHRGPGFGPRRSSGGGAFALVIVLIIIALVAVMATKTSGSIPRSTANRAKLDVNASYQTDLVYDELNWIDTSNVSKQLGYFYNKTGIQPALALFAYKDGITGIDSESEAYAKKWYDLYVEGEGGLLLAYFDTGTEDEGTAYLIYGDMVKSLFDAECEDIFWANYDTYWLDSSVSLNDGYPAMFNDTADRIMQKTTTGTDVIFVVAVLAVIVVAVVSVVRVMKLRRRHEAEKAAETERILNADIGSIKDAEAEDLADKYNNGE